MSEVLLFLGGFATGILVLITYLVLRMLRADGWDRSNVLNALRVLSYVVMHPGRLVHLRDPDGYRPFWYAEHDEFSEIVNRSDQP